jgi:hypothetical protein
MCDAFTRLDLERILWDLAPKHDPASDDDAGVENAMDKIVNASADGFSLVLNTLEDAREALDDDAPDGKTVLAAMDKVIAAIGQIEDFRTTLDQSIDDAGSKQNALISGEDERREAWKIDPESLIAELEYHGYQLVKMPRRPAVAPVVKRRKRHLRAVG